MTQEQIIVAMTAAFEAADKAAKASLGVGKPFLGAFGIARQLGYERNGVEWNAAVHAAADVFQVAEIYTDENGIQVVAR